MNLFNNRPFPKREILFAGTFIVAGLALYARSLSVPFLSDDYYALYAFQHQGLRLFYDLHDRTFIPFTLFIMGCIHSVFGPSAAAFRIFSVLIHAMNAWLIYLLITRIFVMKAGCGNKRHTIAFLAGMCFLALPFQAEAVIWVAATAYPLCTFFCLAALLMYLRYRSGKGFHTLLLAGIFYISALLSKEFAVVLPLMIILIELFLYSSNGSAKSAFSKSFMRILYFVIILFAYLLMRRLVLDEWIGLYGSAVHTRFDMFQLLMALSAYAAHFVLLFRYWPAIAGNAGMMLITACAGILVIGFVIAVKVTRSRLLSGKDDGRKLKWSLWLIFTILSLSALLPVINLEITFLTQIQSERYGYFASAFVCPAMVLLIYAVSGNKKRSAVMVILMCSAYIILLQSEIGHFRRAGRIADNVLARSLSLEGSSNQIALLNVPDTYGGVYVFRNGLSEAISTKLKKENTQFLPLTYLSCEVYEAGVSCVVLGDTLVIHALSDQLSIFPDRDVLPAACATLIYARGNRMQFLLNAGQHCRYYTFDGSGDISEVR